MGPDMGISFISAFKKSAGPKRGRDHRPSDLGLKFQTLSEGLSTGETKETWLQGAMLIKHRGTAFIPTGRYLLCLIKNREGGVMGGKDKKRKDYIKWEI